MNAHHVTTHRMLRHSLVTLACLSAIGPALAQGASAPSTAASGAQATQRVEITGSRIKQIEAEGASPVQVINREEIRRMGASNVREALESLTATTTNGSTISDVNGNNTFSPGASQASLRNMGAQSTLLLVDGRRIAIYPLPNFQETFSNVDTIPLAAVDRIEVLKTGGSAVYGSDAIAGVINIITRKDYTGLQVDASTQRSLKNGRFSEKQATLTGGFGNYERDGFNVLGTVEYYHRDELYWSSVLKDLNPAYKAIPGFGTGSTYSWPGNVDLTALPGCVGTVSAGGACLYDRYSRFEAVPLTNRLNTMVSGTLRVDDTTQAYAQVMASRIRAGYQSAYPTYGQAQVYSSWIDPFTGQSKKFWYRGLPSTNPANTTGEDEADFRYRFTDSGGYQHTDTSQWRVLAGLKGAARGWDYDTAVGVLGADTRDRSRGNFSYSGFLQEIGDPGGPITDPSDPNYGSYSTLPADFFSKAGGYVIGGNNSPEVLNTLFPEYGWQASTRQYFLDGNAQTKIADLPAGPVNLSLGYELRHESMVLSPTQNLMSADIVGFSFSSSTGSRNFGALFGEVDVPLARKLDLGIAARLDKFPHFGVHPSPRVNLRYQPVDALALRGTLETGFRAPNLQESSTSTKTAFQTASDPKRCPVAQQVAAKYQQDAIDDPADADYYTALAQQVTGNECNGSVAIIALNNPNLKPETSLSQSFGAVLQLSRHWSATIDYWSIMRRNEINLKSVQDLLSAEGSQPAGTIVRDPLSAVTDPSFTQDDIDTYGLTAGPIASVRLQYGNLLKTRTEGVDFGISGDTDTPAGTLTTTVEGTFTLNYQVYSPTRNVTGAWGDNLSGRYGYPRLQTNFANTLKTGNFSNTLRWKHQTGTKLLQDFNDSWTTDYCTSFKAAAGQAITPSQCHVNNYDRWDYAFEWTGVKDLTLGANVINVFQRRPPLDYRSIYESGGGVIPQNLEDAEGRQLKVYLSYKFL